MLKVDLEIEIYHSSNMLHIIISKPIIMPQDYHGFMDGTSHMKINISNGTSSTQDIQEIRDYNITIFPS
jgi:hypothetical protein